MRCGGIRGMRAVIGNSGITRRLALPEKAARRIQAKLVDEGADVDEMTDIGGVCVTGI